MNLGIIRSVDDLGRIVLPKEIRRKMKINRGTPMEILAGTDGILLKKCYSEEELLEMVKSCIDAAEVLRTDLGQERSIHIKRNLQEVQRLLKAEKLD